MPVVNTVHWVSFFTPQIRTFFTACHKYIFLFYNVCATAPQVTRRSVPVDCLLSISPAVQNRDADLRQAINPERAATCSESGDLQMYALKLKSLHIQRNKKKWNRYLSYHSSSEHTTVADGLDFSPALYLFTLSQDPDLLSLWLTLWLYSSRPLSETWRPSPLGRTISPGLIACLRPASLFCTAGKMDGKLNRTGSTTYLRIHTKS